MKTPQFSKEERILRIEELIPVGRKAAISRKELGLLTGISDREIRAVIEASDLPIINVGEGYFIPDRSDDTDLAIEATYIRSERMRANSIIEKLERKFPQTEEEMVFDFDDIEEEYTDDDITFETM